MSREDEPPGLRELEERVRQARQRNDSTGRKQPAGASADERSKGMLSLAFRIGTEMLAAIIFGVGAGILMDDWLGTKPWGLVIMFFLGAAAGVTNIYRTVGGLGYAPGYPGWTPKSGDKPDDQGAAGKDDG